MKLADCHPALRSVREISRAMRFDDTSSPAALDVANDAWIDAAGRVSERNSRWHFIGDVSHLSGAARITAALSVVSAYRGRIGGAA